MDCEKKTIFGSVKDIMQLKKSWFKIFVVLICVLTDGIRASTPPTPRNLTAYAIDVSSVKLLWNNGRMDRERIKSFSIFYKVKEEVGGFIELTNIDNPEKVIRQLQPGSLYIFQVVAVGHDGTESRGSSIEARTLEAPKVTLAPRDYSVIEDSIISFFCKASGNPQPRFIWKRDGIRINLRRVRYNVYNLPHVSVLRIEPVKAQRDNATFTCIADNDIGTEARANATLTVYPKNKYNRKPRGYPTIRVNPHLQAVERGRQVRMPCEAVAYQAENMGLPKIFWLKDYIPVDLSDPRLSIQNQGTLQIEQSQESDEGRYECIAENSVGVAYSYSANLYVRVRRVPPHFTMVPRNVEVKLFSSANFTCMAVGSPMPTVKWQGGAMEINSGDEFTTGKSTLQLMNITKSKNYTCVAYSPLGSIETDFEVRVKIPGPPRNVRVRAINTTTVIMEWQPPEGLSGLFQSYRILYTLNLNLPLILWERKDVLSDVQAATIENLKPNVTYHMCILAYYMEEEGPVSDLVQVTTRDGVPGSPPKNIRARAFNTTTVIVEWQPPEELNGFFQGYRIFYTSNPHLPEVLWRRKDVLSDVQTATFENLKPNVTYHMYILAYSTYWEGPVSDPIQVMAREGVPGSSPRNVRARAINTTTVIMEWQPPEELNGFFQGYRILYTSNPNLPVNLWKHKDVLSDVQVANIENLKPNAIYHMCILAYSTNAEGPASDPIQVMTPEGVPSAAPQSLSGRPLSSQSIEITWTPPSPEQQNGILIGYKIYYVKSQLDLSEDDADVITVGVSSKALILAPLASWTNYKIWISAFTRVGEGPKSKPIIVRTSEDVPSAAPQSLSGRPLSSHSIEITWTPPSPEQQNGILIGYKIFYVKSQLDLGEDDAEVVTVDALSKVLTLAPLASWTNYKIWISAFTRVGEGPKSQPIIVRTNEDVPSAAPQSLSGRPLSSQSIKITWTPPSPEQQNGILIGYKIYYVKSQLDLSEDDADVITMDAMSREFTLTPLASWTNYKIWISAVTSVGEGPKSQPIIVRTDEDVLPPPKNVKVARISSTLLQVSWDEPRFPVSGYIVYYNAFDLDDIELWQKKEIGPYSKTILNILYEDAIYAVRVRAKTIDHRLGNISEIVLSPLIVVSPTTTDASIPGGSTTSPITRSDITCNGDDISVYVPMDLLPMGRSVTWRDPDCAITNNGTHYVGTVDFNHCGTTVRFNDDSVEFRNELISHSSNHHDTPANAVIDFGDGFDSVVPVECVYPRKENAMASYLPVQGQVRFFEKRMGHLDLELQQVEDQTFTVPVTQGSFPPRVHLNNNFYIKVSSNHMNRSDVGIHLDNCVATPSASPADSTFQPLIKNGCPSMPSVTVYQSPVTEARVGIRAFQFSSHPAQTVYIHCEVSVCPVTDSQCTAGCVASSRQRRAAEPGQKRTSHLLSAGPYILMAEEGSVQVATVVAGICGCIAIVATTFAVVMWRKQRELAAKTIME